MRSWQQDSCQPGGFRRVPRFCMAFLEDLLSSNQSKWSINGGTAGQTPDNLLSHIVVACNSYQCIYCKLLNTRSVLRVRKLGL